MTGDPLLLLVPIGGHIPAGIAKGVPAFDPNFFALEGPLELLQDTQLIVLPVDPNLAVLEFEHGVPPPGRHDPFERHLLRNILILSTARHEKLCKLA